MVAAIHREGLANSTTIIVTAKHGQSPLNPHQLVTVQDGRIIDAIQRGLGQDAPEQHQADRGRHGRRPLAVLLSNNSQSADNFVKNYLWNHAAQGFDVQPQPGYRQHSGLAQIWAGAAAAKFFGVSVNNGTTRSLRKVQVGVVYAKPTKLAEHGGMNSATPTSLCRQRTWHQGQVNSRPVETPRSRDDPPRPRTQPARTDRSPEGRNAGAARPVRSSSARRIHSLRPVPTVLPENSRSCNGDSVNIEGIVEDDSAVGCSVRSGEDPPGRGTRWISRKARVWWRARQRIPFHRFTRVGVGCENAGPALSKTPHSSRCRGELRWRMTAVEQSQTVRVRLAELVAALSLGVDLGFGQPMEHVLRQCVIALRLAERVGLDEASRSVRTTRIAGERGLPFGCPRAGEVVRGRHRPEVRQVRHERGVRAAAASLRLVGSGNPPLHRFRVGLEFALSGIASWTE